MAPLTVPAGLIMSDQPGPGFRPFNIPWSNVSRWEPWFTEAAEESGVPAQLIAAMAIIETNANHTWPSGHPKAGQLIEVWDNFPHDGPSVGIMQVKPQIWGDVLAGADARTPQGSIRLGARLMRNFINQEGSWEEAIKKKYHPGISPNGTTPQMYVDSINALMAEMAGTISVGPHCRLFAPPAFDGTQKTINDVVFHPEQRAVRVRTEGLTARQFATREACVTRAPLHTSETVSVLYWIRGEEVDGEDRWWVANDGARIWSGGTHERPVIS